ncbi:hypothetical protein MTR_8g039340 [Medicago truncatula]|uniref:Uncharacterized protein n=1 Tax=Medicago truncatula TaxID=3880 RepID=G7LG36_MEDTR|nr:hypothetical protein MTR_8g039340 [Medicago truncatula]
MGVAGAATLWIPLLAGEEITCDYHFSHEDEEKKIPCSCNFELTDIKKKEKSVDPSLIEFYFRTDRKKNLIFVGVHTESMPPNEKIPLKRNHTILLHRVTHSNVDSLQLGKSHIYKPRKFKLFHASNDSSSSAALPASAPPPYLHLVALNRRTEAVMGSVHQVSKELEVFSTVLQKHF